MKLKVTRDAPWSRRPWRVLRPEDCHDYCFRSLGAFHTWAQAQRYANAIARGE